MLFSYSGETVTVPCFFYVLVELLYYYTVLYSKPLQAICAECVYSGAYYVGTPSTLSLLLDVKLLSEYVTDSSDSACCLSVCSAFLHSNQSVWFYTFYVNIGVVGVAGFETRAGALQIPRTFFDPSPSLSPSLARNIKKSAGVSMFNQLREGGVISFISYQATAGKICLRQLSFQPSNSTVRNGKLAFV